MAPFQRRLRWWPIIFVKRVAYEGVRAVSPFVFAVDCGTRQFIWTIHMDFVRRRNRQMRVDPNEFEGSLLLCGLRAINGTGFWTHQEPSWAWRRERQMNSNWEMKSRPELATEVESQEDVRNQVRNLVCTFTLICQIQTDSFRSQSWDKALSTYLFDAIESKIDVEELQVGLGCGFILENFQALDPHANLLMRNQERNKRIPNAVKRCGTQNDVDHGPRLYVCHAPNAFICVSGVAPFQTPNAFMCVSPNAFICVSPNAFICVSPNAFICVSPNSSTESTTELASLAYLCSLRSHVFQQSKLKFLSEEHSCPNTDSCLVLILV